MAFRFPAPRDEASRVRREERDAREKTASETMVKLYGLTDRWLAEAILKLAREARAEAPDMLGNPLGGSYEVNFIWQIVPEIAKRLGARTFLPNEATDRRNANCSDTQLRRLTGQYLKNISLDRYAAEVREADGEGTALDLLGRDFVNGNPVAIAMDRVAPPNPEVLDRQDWLTAHMEEVSRSRFGDIRYNRWSPEFQDYESANSFVIEGIDDENHDAMPTP